MKVHVRLWGNLYRYVPGEKGKKFMVVDVPPESTMKDVQSHLHIPGWAVDLMFLNGTCALSSQTLTEDDRIAFFPRLLAGG